MSKNQFLFALLINSIVVIFLLHHYLSLPERVVVQTKTETKEVEKVVNKCDETTKYTQLMEAAKDTCNAHGYTVREFSVDDKEHPKFNCN